MSNVAAVENGVTKQLSPVDNLTTRYPTTGVAGANTPASTFERSRATLETVPTGGMSASRSPSLAVTQSMSPPYTLDIAARTPALTTLNSLRQPYTLLGENRNSIQLTPSLSTIPPSLGASLMLSDLRPKGVAPKLLWELGTTTRVLYPPLVTPRRLWGASDGRMVVAMAKSDGKRELEVLLPDLLAATPAQVETTGYFPVGDGNLYAVDLLGGDRSGGLNQLWRANCGGIMNHTPLVTKDSVYASGDNSGVTRLDRATGAITWRSEHAADLAIAANNEFVYIRDRQGRFLVYDAKRATDPQNRASVSLSGLNLPEFNIPVVNTVTDRVYLAADNGLIVCMRDASPKYRMSVRMAPAPITNPAPKEEGKKPETPVEAKPIDASEKKP
jgi:hypothetical protein